MEEVNANPFAQGSQPQEIPATEVPTGEPHSETLSDAGGAATEEVAPPPSPLELLDGLLTELEGAPHMSKIEILAVVMKYRTLRGE